MSAIIHPCFCFCFSPLTACVMSQLLHLVSMFLFMTLWGRSGCEFTAGGPCWLGKLQQTTQRTLSLPRHSRVDRASASLFHGFWISPPTKNGWAGTPSTCWCGFSPDHPFVLCCPLVLLSSLRLRIFFFFLLLVPTSPARMMIACPFACIFFRMWTTPWPPT